MTTQGIENLQPGNIWDRETFLQNPFGDGLGPQFDGLLLDLGDRALQNAQIVNHYQ